jgi:predicted Zn-dependent peptidase
MQRDRIVTIDEHVERLRAVTADDVARVLHRVLDTPRSLAAVGPFEAEDLVG